MIVFRIATFPAAHVITIARKTKSFLLAEVEVLLRFRRIRDCADKGDSLDGTIMSRDAEVATFLAFVVIDGAGLRYDYGCFLEDVCEV